jgi:hypothetical protein
MVTIEKGWGGARVNKMGSSFLFSMQKQKKNVHA